MNYYVVSEQNIQIPETPKQHAVPEITHTIVAVYLTKVEAEKYIAQRQNEATVTKWLSLDFPHYRITEVKTVGSQEGETSNEEST